MTYELLEWDTEFFGFPIGRIREHAGSDTIAQSLARADQEGIRCLYHLVAADRLAALHEALCCGFRPYDIRIELERPLEGPAQWNQTTPAREADPTDEEILVELAAQTITGTRFTLDDHFPQERVPLLYAEWVKRALRSGPGQRVLLAEPAAGFVICGLNSQHAVGTIELIGVASRFHRRGIGRGLLSDAHAVMLNAGCDVVRVVTQGRNLAAQRLYQGLGYKTLSVAWWLHRWHHS